MFALWQQSLRHTFYCCTALVLANFSGAAPELGVVLEGESLLNDGSAIILFNVFLALSIPNHDFSSKSNRSVNFIDDV